MQKFSINPYEFFSSVWTNRHLITASVRREILERYQGSMAGMAWSVINPVMMLLVYTFVFSVVFKARWGEGQESKAQFALILFSGLIVFNFFSECIGRASNLIVSNQNYVKKVVFPLEVLPLVSLGVAAFNCAINMGVWVIAYIVMQGAFPNISVLLLPVVLAPLCFFILGLSWILSAIGVFLRDVGQFVTIMTAILLFVSPIFYPASALPEEYQNIVLINPLAAVIEETRNLLFLGGGANIKQLSLNLIGSMLIAWGGFAFFQTTRKGFADVL